MNVFEDVSLSYAWIFKIFCTKTDIFLIAFFCELVGVPSYVQENGSFMLNAIFSTKITWIECPEMSTSDKENEACKTD